MEKGDLYEKELSRQLAFFNKRKTVGVDEIVLEARNFVSSLNEELDINKSVAALYFMFFFRDKLSDDIKAKLETYVRESESKENIQQVLKKIRLYTGVIRQEIKSYFMTNLIKARDNQKPFEYVKMDYLNSDFANKLLIMNSELISEEEMQNLGIIVSGLPSNSLSLDILQCNVETISNEKFGKLTVFMTCQGLRAVSVQADGFLNA
jgi:hypothetical protein